MELLWAVAILALQVNENVYKDFSAESRIVATACGQRPRLRGKNKAISLHACAGALAEQFINRKISRPGPFYWLFISLVSQVGFRQMQ